MPIGGAKRPAAYSQLYATLVFAPHGGPALHDRFQLPLFSPGGWANINLVEVYTQSLELDEIEAYLPMRGKLG